MDVKYADKVNICRQKELQEYRDQIMDILEESRELAQGCENLVKIRALRARCEKILKPRGTIKTDAAKEEKRKNYHDNKEKYLLRKQEKRQQIRAMGQVHLGKFLEGITT